MTGVAVFALLSVWTSWLLVRRSFLDSMLNTLLVDIRLMRWRVNRDVRDGHIPAENAFVLHINRLADTMLTASVQDLPGPITVLAWRWRHPRRVRPDPGVGQAITACPALLPHAVEYIRIFVSLVTYQSLPLLMAAWTFGGLVLLMAGTVRAYSKAVDSVSAVFLGLVPDPRLAQA